MKKLLTILGSIGLVATSGVAAVACNTSDKTKMSDEKKEEEKVDLAKVVKQKDLGFISKKEDEIIKKAFIKQNSIDEKKVTVSVKGNVNGVSNSGSTNAATTNTNNSNLNDSAVIELKATSNSNETKTVTVVFEVNNNLAKLIQVKKLKGLPDNKDETILKALDKLNPKSNLDTFKLSIERKDKEVFIKSGSDNTYTGNPVQIEIESKVGVYVGLSLLSVALLASSGFIIYRSLKKKKK
ncbi:lipoprotein [Mycoplasma capricolum subsp. capripneumoniae]|uniref:Prolipoprotein n=1 Tax=Mycoplasma capricolum subsp. capripneumoniae 87001 TaxID=1124992 RepID=A0A9N7B147_MYCCC|nr:lipoprotein [Mycoplasma capricolum]AJK51610.1 prolipoprotein [Mycoplasma capricolum subsp. capripneumoniae 87001]AOQ22258.1 lipoprotein [Mycoplasma capricolum subsp. capripneumoniae M1601]KEY84582.1 hypothetical protein MCCP_2690 [Mycoplasma capricolum subsp. capripneumoniae 99108]QDL19721.1 lipoprotein [Mycoplasma capricolum subsp. capripneumoniae]QDL20406.1 lipoprotein [Mycoplasma capricolum subsp. capripneumoniae]